MGKPITFVDVETTGLTREDRVVSLGVISYGDEEALRHGEAADASLHLVFNPGRPSHPRARAVHGFSDEELALQDLFSAHAEPIWQYVGHGGKVVAHNASFDRRFISSEMAASGMRQAHPKYDCTMLAHRQRYGSRSGLDAVLGQMGLAKRSGHHGALEDAWYAARVYCWLNGYHPARPLEHPGRPSNLRGPGIVDAPTAFEPVATRAETSGLVAELQRQLSPMATVMMSIARADDDFSNDEIDAMVLFLDSRLGQRLDVGEADRADLLAALVDVEISSEAVNDACARIILNEQDANEVAYWVRQVTYADGGGSAAESQAIARVIEGVRAAKRVKG